MEEEKQDLTPDLFPKNYYKEQIALDCLKALLVNPKIVELDFDTVADFAIRHAEAFIKKLNEPEV